MIPQPVTWIIAYIDRLFIQLDPHFSTCRLVRPLLFPIFCIYAPVVVGGIVADGSGATTFCNLLSLVFELSSLLHATHFIIVFLKFVASWQLHGGHRLID